MEHLLEFNEEVKIVEEESPEVRKNVVLSVPSPPARDVFRGRGRGEVRETRGPISASLSAMRPLVGKLDMLLLRDAPQECSSKRVKDGMCLLKDDVEKISSYLDDLSELEDPSQTAKCWMNEVRDLSYNMEDYIGSLIIMRPKDHSPVTNIKSTRSLHKFSSHIKTPKSHVIIVETLLEFRMYVQEAIQRYQRYNLHSRRASRRRFVSLGPMLLPMPYEETDEIVIDGRMNKFINSLVNDGDQQLKVLSVLGSACLGKTTLARVMYSRFRKQYSCRAFIWVSKKHDMKRIFRDMLSQLQRQHPPQHYMETDLIHSIKEYLQDKSSKRYWMAKGFIDTAEGQDMVKVAERYLDQLIGRRLIQPICINYNNEVLSCAVHDMVHDLIAYKSEEENFVLAIDYSQTNVSLSHKVHRLSLLFGDARYAKTPANIRKSQVRSLRFFWII